MGGVWIISKLDMLTAHEVMRSILWETVLGKWVVHCGLSAMGATGVSNGTRTLGEHDFNDEQSSVPHGAGGAGAAQTSSARTKPVTRSNIFLVSESACF